MSGQPDNVGTSDCGYLDNSLVADAVCSDIMPFFCYTSTQDLNDGVISETFSEEAEHVVWKIATTKQTMQLRFTLDKEFKVAAPNGTDCFVRF
ncbi:hypothetical protein Baya_16636 [Bagarius yarrelli]|uniref:Uncharacterized protein n=1 Tax=Bagarius yarrelli TaxID=175774 RepID=A0A556VW51_BAGYA|nr:hypothetical protein Baya_16636 [Bagarius yarrelli]